MDGFVYVKQKDLANEMTSFECEKRRQSLCKAKIKVKNNAVVGTVNHHTHAPEIGKAQALKTRQQMKRRAKATEETSQQIGRGVAGL